MEAKIRVFANFTNNTAQWSAQVTSPTASNIKNFQVNAVASLSSPAIQSVNGDSPVIGSNTPQSINISGTGFIATPTVVLNWNVEPPTGGAYTLPSTQVQLVSSTLLRISITTTIIPTHGLFILSIPTEHPRTQSPFPSQCHHHQETTRHPPAGQTSFEWTREARFLWEALSLPAAWDVNFKATLSDPDDDNVKIEVELRKLPDSFTGVATHSSGYVTSGFQAVTAAATGLAAGNYGWKYRIVDNRGAAGRWSSVGTPDFIVTSGFPPQGELSSISASWYPSGNYDARPIGQTIDAIVIHTTEGSYSSSLAELTNTAVTKSAHFIVDTDGSIVQLVMLADRAWHANYYNDRSIGIEVVGYSNQASTWNEAVRGSLVNLVAALAKEYGIPVVHPGGNASTYPSLLFDEPGIVGHNQIQPGGNGYSFRSDPGQYFDWNGLIADVQSRIGGETPQKPSIYSVTQPIQSKNASQDFEIIGTGFAENCQVTLEDLTTGEHPFDNRKVFARDPDGNRLLLRPNFGSDSINHNWVVRVKNPGTVWSQDFPFVATPHHHQHLELRS